LNNISRITDTSYWSRSTLNGTLILENYLSPIKCKKCQLSPCKTAWILIRPRGCAGWSGSMLVANALCWFYIMYWINILYWHNIMYWRIILFIENEHPTFQVSVAEWLMSLAQSIHLFLTTVGSIPSLLIFMSVCYPGFLQKVGGSTWLKPNINVSNSILTFGREKWKKKIEQKLLIDK
jgi:hypothetical protein